MKSTLKVMSFDLGSNLGWAYVTYNLIDRKMCVNDYGTIDLSAKVASSSLAIEKPWLPMDVLRILAFKDCVKRLTSRINFDWFVCEDLYFDPRRVTALGPLMAYMSALKIYVSEEHSKMLITVPPTVIKQTISGDSTASKLDVQQAIANHPDISFKNNKIVFDQHAADAIGAAYAVMVSRMNFDI